MKPMVLVVDDEEEICDYIRDILVEESCLVKQAFCGEDVPKIVLDESFDIAFVDLKLSTAVSGLDVIKLLRENHPKMKVVAMTGYVDAHLKHQVEGLGVSLFLEKPFSPGYVTKAVKDLFPK